MNYTFDEWVKITKRLSDYYSEHDKTPVHISFYPFIDTNGNPKGYIICKNRPNKGVVSITSYTFSELDSILEKKT